MKKERHILIRKARARAYKRYYIWLTQHMTIKESLQIPLLRFKKK